jgi:hypothetical protein
MLADRADASSSRDTVATPDDEIASHDQTLSSPPWTTTSEPVLGKDFVRGFTLDGDTLTLSFTSAAVGSEITRTLVFQRLR